MERTLPPSSTSRTRSSSRVEREFASSSRLIYSDLGNSIVGFEVDATTHGAIVEDLISLKDANSKVDLDEEAVSLIQYRAAIRQRRG